MKDKPNESVYIRKEFNSYTDYFFHYFKVHQHVLRFIVSRGSEMLSRGFAWQEQ